MNPLNELNRAVELIKNSSHTTAFTGAGVSVESCIPPFRGENGLWSKPASMIPMIAKNNGTKIIEINIEGSNYTNSITDVFLKGKATEIMMNLLDIAMKIIY